MILGLTGILTGFFISFEFFTQWEPRLEKIRGIVEKYSKYLGIISIFVGIWKFFGPDLTASISEYISDTITQKITYISQPFVGDLLPSIFCFLGGIILFPESVNLINIKEEKRKKILEITNNFKMILGLGNIILGLVHLLIPNVILF
ncbi:MAG TPA: hypothetical protein PKW55_05820 [Spirochaetota bacterium]|nr:hypothetical protein [Spirochaetota bacterium]HOM37530.1 hypothetical protein [Spirochaetota bacterium]HPQ49498.1 hypothetical protein [Spirochaetota bacterium]